MIDLNDLLLGEAEPVAAEKVASDPNETREDYIARSKREGLLITFPAANELQIDLDNDTHRDAFERSFEIFNRELGGNFQMQRTRSKSGAGEHIRIKLGFDLDVWQRIAWQAALGSDPVRELLSCLRAWRGDAQPTLLAEKPGFDLSAL